MKKRRFHNLIACTTAFSLAFSLSGCEAGISRPADGTESSAPEDETDISEESGMQPDAAIILEDVVQEPLPAQNAAGRQKGLFANEEAEYAYEVYLALCRRAYGADFTFARAIPRDPAVVWKEMLDARDREERRVHYLSLPERTFLTTLQFPPLEKSADLLQRRLEQLVSSYDGVWSVYTKNLSDGEEVIVHDRAMASASVMKLFVMAAVYEAIEDGSLQRTDEITSLLASMISVSSNESANRLLALLGNGDYAAGIDKVNQYFRTHGYTGRSHEFNGFANDATVVAPGHFNRITARDCARLLEQVYHREFGSWAVCSEIEKNMLAQQTRYKIPAGIARINEGVQIGNKTGEMDQVENDVAIVYSPACDYIICVFSGEWSSYDTAVRHIQDLSEEIYRYYNDPDWISTAACIPDFLISDKLPWDPMFYTDPAEAAKLSRGVRALTAWKPPVIPADPDAAPGTVSKENTDYVSLYAIGTDAALPEEDETEYLVLSDADEAGILIVNGEMLMDGFLTGTEAEAEVSGEAEVAGEAAVSGETDMAEEAAVSGEMDMAGEAAVSDETERIDETEIPGETEGLREESPVTEEGASERISGADAFRSLWERYSDKIMNSR